MDGALEGIRIIDLSWVVAGPGLTRYFADFGAEVIKVESSLHPDLCRTTAPYCEGLPGLNRSGHWANLNLNKYSMNVNLKNPKGRAVVKRLVAEADAVVENFTPSTMEQWGLGYNDLVKVNPDLIMVSISLFGETGPYSKRFGIGTFAEAVSGFLDLFGWPDRCPSYFQTVVGDALVPSFGVSALVAALEHRNKTGEGQWFDLNQLDVLSYVMAPLILDASVNGRQATRAGNISPGSCPHAVYPCLGDDRWCAIAVNDDREWDSLCLAMGDSAWCHDERFSTFIGRKENEAELDTLVAAWTVQFTPDKLMRLLQKKGVAAGAVLIGEGIYTDPQLKHRNAVWYMKQVELGRYGYYTSPAKLSLTPAEARMPPPILGEHTEFVCTEILKMSPDEFVGLLNEGVFE